MKYSSQVGALVAAITLLAGCNSNPGNESGTTNAPAASDEAGAPAQAAATESTQDSTSDSGQRESAVPTAEPQVRSGDHPVPAVNPPTAFLQCGSCHSVEPGKDGVGPSLAGIVGRPAGSLAGYTRYSPALKASGTVWTPDKLDEWLKGPMQMVPGTRMALMVRDPDQRKAIIDYLKTLR